MRLTLALVTSLVVVGCAAKAIVRDPPAPTSVPVMRVRPPMPAVSRDPAPITDMKEMREICKNLSTTTKQTKECERDK
jgi:hypothetical protein